MVELELLDAAGKPALTRRLTSKALYLGRAPTNDVVLADDTVSGRHASVWLVGGSAWIEDLGSRNGTFVNDDRTKGTHELKPGDVVRLGTGPSFRIRGEVPQVSAGVTLLEDLETGVQQPFRSDRFTIGSDPSCSLVVEDATPFAATLLIHRDGDVQLGIGDLVVDLAPDREFEVAGRRLCLRVVDGLVTETREVGTHEYPYRLVATLGSATGPAATLTHAHTDAAHTVSAPNRAILLYILANHFVSDRDDGLAEVECGWAYDTDVAQGIWGKAAAEKKLNNLHVLISRTRRELKGAGFDPWFIEKRRRYLRVRVLDARVT